MSTVTDNVPEVDKEVNGPLPELAEAPIHVQPVPLDPPPPYSLFPEVHTTEPTTGPNPETRVAVVNRRVGPVIWGHVPKRVKCPSCHRVAVTVVKSEWRWERCCNSMLCFVCMDVNCGCKGTQHYCPDCHRCLGYAK